MRSSALLFGLELLELFFQRADLGDSIFFLLPLGLQRIRFLADFGQFLLETSQPLARVRVVFFFQRLLFDFQLRGPALELIDLGGHGIDLNAQGSRGFVNQVDGLVGQEAVGDVAMRQASPPRQWRNP